VAEKIEIPCTNPDCARSKRSCRLELEPVAGGMVELTVFGCSGDDATIRIPWYELVELPGKTAH